MSDDSGAGASQSTLPLRSAGALFLLVGYLGQVLLHGQATGFDADQLLRVGASAAPALAAGEVWRVLSAIVVHGSPWHLIANIWVWWELGAALQRATGSPLSAGLVLLASGATGFLASAGWQPDTVSVGASGALLGALGFLLWQRWRARAPVAPYLLFLVMVAAAGGLLPEVDNAAHAGGFAAGVLLAAVDTAAGARPGRRLRRPVLRGAAVVLLAAVLAGAQALPAAWAVPYQEAGRFEAAYRRFAQTDAAVTEHLKALAARSTSAAGLGRVDALAAIARDATQPLTQAADDWAAARYATDWIDKERQLVARYAALRLAAVRELAQAIRTDDAAAMSRFERLQADAEALGAELARPARADRQTREAAGRL